jgi:hypothetical protein
MGKSTERYALVAGNPAVTVLPSPKLNLHNLEAVRREMARVYRDMRGGAINTQDGTRLVYVLGEMRKLFEILELEQRIRALEEKR